VIATAPVNAAYADIAFSQVTSSSNTMNTGMMLDQVLFEQSSTVNSNAGWSVKRYSNDRIQFELISNYGSNIELLSSAIYDNEWHHVALNMGITTSTNEMVADMFIDGSLYTFADASAATISNSYPVRINHSTTSGLKDELMLYANKNISAGVIKSHYNNGKDIYKYISANDNIASRLITFPVLGSSKNTYLDFNINSYVYSGSTATFNVDNTEFIYTGTQLYISGYNPYTGSSVFGSPVTVISIDGPNTFTASGTSISAASATSASSGNGFYGNAAIISSDPISQSLSAIQSPKVGTAVASDVIKTFITNFTYNINKRFTMTDFVDVSMEFTEI
jgi:hypothetical protein